MNLTDRLTQLLLGTMVAGLTLAPATLAGAAQPEPGGNGDLTSEPPCQPDWEPCGPDPCEEGDDCEPPVPCEEEGQGEDCPTPPESCEDGGECPEPEPDPDPEADPEPEPVDPPVVARPNFTG